MGTSRATVIHDRSEAALARRVARYLRIARFALIASAVTGLSGLGALLLMSPEAYSIISSLVFIPSLAIACTVAVASFTWHDAYLRRLMFASLWAHIAASALFLWIGFAVYGGTADAFHYWTVGLMRAADFQSLGWAAFPGPYWSTNLIGNICGVAALLIGDALPTAFIAFALVPLGGTYLFYRAFEVAFPNGDRWLFGVLVALLPSLLFWTSFVGKDSLIQIFIALTCFGFARVIVQTDLRAVLACAIGLFGVLLIRVHIAIMLAIAITFPFAVSRSRAGRANIVLKILLVPLLTWGTYILIRNAQSMLGLPDNPSATVLDQEKAAALNSQIGGSAFNGGASLPVRISEAPFLMFRPFPWEVHNLLGIASAVESLGWICLCWSRRREIWWTIRHWRDPYISFLLVYAFVFVIMFAGAINNFGILLRQRIMLTPLALMVICAKTRSLEPAGTRESGTKGRLFGTPGRWRSDRMPTAT